MPSIFKHIQYLSLDIVAGAIISSLFIARIFGSTLDWPVLLGLGIAIWLIYTADHLIDARKSDGIPNNERHAFHKRYFNGLLVLSVILFSVGVWNLNNLTWTTISIGLVLVGMVILYFLSIQLFDSRSYSYKELSAALIYCFGIFTGPLGAIQSLEVVHVYLLFQFLIVVLLNLLIFPLYELETDRSDQVQSLVTVRGVNWIRKVIQLLGLLLAVSLAFGIVARNYFQLDLWLQGQFVLSLMLLVLMGLFYYPSYFSGKNLYRIVGDGIFIMPAVLWL